MTQQVEQQKEDWFHQFASLKWYDENATDVAPEAGLWYNDHRKLLSLAVLQTPQAPRRKHWRFSSMDTLSLWPQDDNPPMKRCPACPEGQQWHPATPEFFHRDKGSKDGLICWCKACKSQKEKKYNQKPEVWNRQKAYRERNKERITQRDKAWYEASKQKILATRKTQYQANQERDRFASIKKLYGLTPEEWKGLFERQKGQCALCGNDFDVSKSKFIQVDHCHKTGVVRGLLCLKCNVGLGAFGDNPELLLKAVYYLKGDAL